MMYGDDAFPELGPGNTAEVVVDLHVDKVV